MAIVLLQILVATALGAALGIQREFSAQQAGLRTHMLVSLGSALFTLSGVALDDQSPTRVAAQVVTGIGFLGGGAILKYGIGVRGMTTAASLWLAAAIGLAVGLKEWFGAVAATVVGVAVLWLLKVVEDQLLPKRRPLLVLLTVEPDAKLDDVAQRVIGRLGNGDVTRVSYAEGKEQLEVSTAAAVGTSLAQVAEALRELPGVAGVELTR